MVLLPNQLRLTMRKIARDHRKNCQGPLSYEEWADHLEEEGKKYSKCARQQHNQVEKQKTETPKQNQTRTTFKRF